MVYAMLKLPEWMPRPGKGSKQRGERMMRESVRKMLAERRALINPPDDLMQRLINAKDPESGQTMSDELLIDNLLTFYLAGHETTAKALAWTLRLRALAWAEPVLMPRTSYSLNARTMRSMAVARSGPHAITFESSGS